MKLNKLSSAIVMATVLCAPLEAATWSDTFIGYRYGSEFSEPSNAQDVSKNIVQLTHASGYSLGQNYFNLDVLKSGSEDPASGSSDGATEFYLAYRHQLHLGKLFETDLGFGPVKEVALTAGFDLNTKNSAFAPRKRFWVVGPTLKFDVPGFLDLSLYYANESNHCGLAFCTHNDLDFDPYYQVNLAWGLPFETAGLPMKFQGFSNYNGKKGTDYFNNETKPEHLIRTSLMVDVGQLAMNKKNTLWVGVGYEYWHNKYGNHGKPGVDTRAPFINAEWHF